MHKTVRHSFFLLVCWLGLAVLGLQPLAAAAGPDALVDSTTYATELASYEAQLADLESQFGPYHQSLLEPLQSLTALEQSQGNYARVAEFQNRQLQVMRTVMGFRHPDLIPLVNDIIANEIKLGHWEEVSEHLEHMRYLVGGENDDSSTALMHAIQDQADWHLARIYLGKKENRARNFLQAREYYDDLLRMAEEQFGEDSQERVPWLYKQVMSEYRLVELLNAKDGISGDTLDRLVRAEGVGRLQTAASSRLNMRSLWGDGRFIPVVDEDELVGQDYLRDAKNSVHDIVELYEAAGDLEAQAMATIYEADFLRLMGRGSAMGKYRDARELLLEAGIEEASIDQYFRPPMVFPVPELFLTLDAALAYQQQLREGLGEIPEGQLHLGNFVAWQEGLPDVAKPVPASALLDLELPYQQLDASMSISSSGAVSSVELVGPDLDDRHLRRKAVRALRELQVRPALVEGRARRTRDVHVRYFVLAEE